MDVFWVYERARIFDKQMSEPLKKFHFAATLLLLNKGCVVESESDTPRHFELCLIFLRNLV